MAKRLPKDIKEINNIIDTTVENQKIPTDMINTVNIQDSDAPSKITALQTELFDNIEEANIIINEIDDPKLNQFKTENNCHDLIPTGPKTKPTKS